MAHREQSSVGGLRLVGRIVDRNGAGVPGAHVWIHARPHRSTTSDRDGSFAFEDLTSRTYEVRALAGDLIGGTHVVRLVASTPPMVVEMGEGAHVLVSVLDAARAPVADAMLRIVDSGSPRRRMPTGRHD